MSRDGVADQLVRIKLHGIGIPVVNGAPQPLEFLPIEAVVERILRSLGLVAVRKHFLEHAVVEDGLNQLMDALRHVLQGLR